MSDSEAARMGQLHVGDVILAVDGSSVINATHTRVISLIQAASKTGQVTLRVRRQMKPVVGTLKLHVWNL